MINKIFLLATIAFATTLSYGTTYHETRHNWSYQFKSGERVEGFFKTNSYFDEPSYRDEEKTIIYDYHNSGDSYYQISEFRWQLLAADGSFIGADQSDSFSYSSGPTSPYIVSGTANIAKDGSTKSLFIDVYHDTNGAYDYLSFSTSEKETSVGVLRARTENQNISFNGNIDDIQGTPNYGWRISESGNSGWSLESANKTSVPNSASTALLFAATIPFLALARKKMKSHKG